MKKTRNYWNFKITRKTVEKAKELTKQGFGYKHITKELNFSAGTYRRMQNVKFEYDEYLNYANFEKKAYGYNKCLEIAKKEGYSNVAQYVAENGNKKILNYTKMKKLFENVLIEVVLSDDIITSKKVSEKLDLNLNVTKAILKTLHQDKLIETASINDEKGKFLGSGYFATDKGIKNYKWIVINRQDKKYIKKSDKKETYLLILLALFFSLLVGYMLCKILTL